MNSGPVAILVAAGITGGVCLAQTTQTAVVEDFEPTSTKGTKEPNPFPGAIGAFRTMLDKAGVRYTYYESIDTAHEWLTWRRDLNQFARSLFR